MLIDTHCHIHSDDYPLDREEVLRGAFADGVERVVCIGTSLSDSRRAVSFAERHAGVYATVGIHPSEDTGAVAQVEGLKKLIKTSDRAKMVAVGEIGLDYHYQPFDKAAQIRLFEAQLQLAVDFDLPVVFHVREAFSDTFAVIDNFSGLRGVLHSFTGNAAELAAGLRRGFYVSLNGIATFSKDKNQLETFDKVPMARLLLETDAPYLTPKPFRGRMNEPRYVKEVARWVADHRGVELSEVEQVTSDNAIKLFNL
ncbi:MAG: TatD family hydrolase [Candidatus Nomurabacteria bacterium]|jgi:TatD DNase family protein|nr:TatD family hydrolase [Candidatus Nomurabacteria bacterium]